MNVDSKGKVGRVEITRQKNFGGIKYEGGLLLSFVVSGGSAVWKSQHHRFPPWCIFCVNIISTRLLLKILKGVYIIIST